MSSPPASLGDLLSHSPGREFEQTPHRVLPPRPSQTPPQRPAQPPRLPSSPRLFREFFNLSAMSDTASRRQATLPRANYQDTVQDVNRALRSANRALQEAQDAFHQVRRFRPGTRPGITESRALRIRHGLPSNSPSPPDHSAESHFISRTTHPHDSTSNQRSRRLNTLDEPVYGQPPRRSPNAEAEDTLPVLRLFPIPATHLPRLPHLQADHNRLQAIVDQEAINRQRENHSSWERMQARNRDQIQCRSRNPSPEMSPPRSSSSRRTRHQASSPPADPTIESVDLTGVDDNAGLSAALAKQREDAILSQNPGTEAGRTPLTAYKCPVCMDVPTDATSTICGHVFCHRCIIDTLNWSIEQRREDAPRSRKVKGVCPVCRKQLDTKDIPGPTRSLVPLELKLLVRKRKRDDKGKQKLVKAETISDDEDDDEGNGADKETPRARKRKRETTEDAMWEEFMEVN